MGRLNLFTLHLPPYQIGFTKKQKPSSTHKQNTLDLLETGNSKEYFLILAEGKNSEKLLWKTIVST
jgi:hypothetical protein